MTNYKDDMTRIEQYDLPESVTVAQLRDVLTKMVDDGHGDDPLLFHGPDVYSERYYGPEPLEAHESLYRFTGDEGWQVPRGH